MRTLIDACHYYTTRTKRTSHTNDKHDIKPTVIASIIRKQSSNNNNNHLRNRIRSLLCVCVCGGVATAEKTALLLLCHRLITNKSSENSNTLRHSRVHARWRIKFYYDFGKVWYAENTFEHTRISCTCSYVGRGYS